jgi:hypothetical protein
VKGDGHLKEVRRLGQFPFLLDHCFHYKPNEFNSVLITIVGKQKGPVNLAGANGVVDRTHHLGDTGPEEARLASSLAGRQDSGSLADESVVLYELIRQRIQEMNVPYTIIHIKPDVPRPSHIPTV